MSITVENKEIIRARMLAEVPEKYDRAVGSFFFDTFDPAAAELSRAQQKGADALDDSFVETAEGEDLDRVVYDRKALRRKKATYAVGEITVSGSPGATIPVGLIVVSDAAEFTVTASGAVGEDGFGTVPVMCTVEGTVGNVPAGAIKSFGVSYSGLAGVTNEEATEDGFDEESDEDLRERCLAAMRDPGTSGNPTHYREWAMEVNGVGDARVVPIWNGPGTVKVIIIGADRLSVGETLVQEVAAHIQTKRPVGADVTVVSAVEKPVNVTATVMLEVNADVEKTKADFTAKLAEYLGDIAFDQSFVSHARVSALLITSADVEDHKNLQLNGAAANLTLTDDEVGTAGTVTLNVG